MANGMIGMKYRINQKSMLNQIKSLQIKSQ